jgi:hypothetical protein
MKRQDPPPLKCETCSHFREGIYYEPVCYELSFIDNKKWATKVTYTRKACSKYRARINAVQHG